MGICKKTCFFTCQQLGFFVISICFLVACGDSFLPAVDSLEQENSKTISSRPAISSEEPAKAYQGLPELY